MNYVPGPLERDREFSSVLPPHNKHFPWTLYRFAFSYHCWTTEFGFKNTKPSAVNLTNSLNLFKQGSVVRVFISFAQGSSIAPGTPSSAFLSIWNFYILPQYSLKASAHSKLSWRHPWGPSIIWSLLVKRWHVGVQEWGKKTKNRMRPRRSIKIFCRCLAHCSVSCHVSRNCWYQHICIFMRNHYQLEGERFNVAAAAGVGAALSRPGALLLYFF